MVAVELDLVIDLLLIAFQFGFGVAVMGTVFRDAKMLDVDSPVALLDGEVRGVGLVRLTETIRIYLLVLVIDLVEIQEVCNLDFLSRAQRLVVDGNGLAGTLVCDGLHVLVHIGAHRREVSLRDVIEEGIEVVTFVRRIEITAEEEDEFIHHLRLPQDVVLQVVVDDIEHETAVHHILLVGILLSENGIAGLVEGGDRAVYLQGLVNLVAKFAHGLVGERYDEYLFRCDVLAFHKVLHLGGHSGGLSRTSAGYDQHIVFVCENHLPLLFVQGDGRIDFGEYDVQIMLLRDKVVMQVGLIVLLDAG